MANKYANLIGTNLIKDEYTKINTGFDGVDADMKAVESAIENHGLEADPHDQYALDTDLATLESALEGHELDDTAHGIGAIAQAVDNLEQEVSSHKAEKASYAKFAKTATQSIPNTGSHEIVWDVKTSYNGEDFCEIDPTTKRIKILKKGMYQLTTTLTFAGSAVGARSFQGVTLANTYPTNTNQVYMTISEFIYATAGQLLKSKVAQSSTGALDLNVSVTTCSIRKVI